MEVIDPVPVSIEVIERIRRESRLLVRAADGLSADLETGHFDEATAVASSLGRRLRAHVALVDAVLDALTLDSQPPGRGSPGPRRGPRPTLPADLTARNRPSSRPPAATPASDGAQPKKVPAAPLWST
jgi:hypothetical protein